MEEITGGKDSRCGESNTSPHTETFCFVCHSGLDPELAAEQPSAKELDLAEVFQALHENFQKARKPLNFVAEFYLQYRRNKLFV